MIRIFVFFILFLSSIYANNIESIFPQGEKIEEDYIINSSSEVIDSLIVNSGKFIITIEYENISKLKLWNTLTKRVFYIKDIKEYIKHISITKDDKLLVYCSDNNISFFDLEKKRVIKQLNSNESINSLSISADGKYLVYTTKQKVYLYNIAEEKLEYFFEEEEGIKKIIISHKNSYIVVLTKNKKSSIKLYDLKTSRVLNNFNLDNKRIEDIDISSDEQTIGVILSGTLKLIDIKSEKIKNFINEYFDLLKFSFDNQTIITFSYNKIQKWNINTKENITSITLNYPNMVNKFSISKDSKFMIIPSLYPVKVYLSNLITGKIFNLNHISTQYKNIYLRKSNKVISIENEDNKGVKLWDLNKNKLDSILEKNQVINDISISSNEKYLIYSVDNNKTIKVIDLSKKKEIYKYIDKNNNMDKIRDIAINNNATRIVYIIWKIKDNINKVVIVDVNESKVLKKIDKEFSDLEFLNQNQIYMGGSKSDKIFDIEKNKFVLSSERNESIFFYTNNRYYEISKSDINKTIIKDILTDKTVFSLSSLDENIAIIDIIDKYIFIKNYSSNYINIWNIEKQKYQDIKDLKDKFYIIDWRYSNQIPIFNINQNKIEKSIYIQKNNNWMIIDHIENKLYRNTLEILLLNSKTFQPIVFQKNIFSREIAVYIQDKIKLANNSKGDISIQIKNLSKKNLYWIEPIINDANFTITSKPIYILKPNEIKNIKISLNYNDRLKQSFTKKLNLKVAIGGKAVKEKILTVKVEKKIDIDIESIKLEDNGISIKFKKFIDTNLTNLKVTLSEGNKSIENNRYYNYSFPTIETNSSIKIYLPNQGVFGYTFGKGHDFIVTVNADEIKSYTFKRHVKFDMSKGLYIIFGMFILMILSIPYAIYLGIFNRNIEKIMWGNLSVIYNTKLKKLPYYKKILKRRLKKEYFERYFIEDFDKVVKFFEVKDKEKANIFAQKANGKFYQLDNNFFEITLSQNFELSLESFLLYFPNSTDENTIFNILKEQGSQDIIFVIGQTEEEQKQINESDKVHTLPYVIGISPKNLKLFLLKRGHTKTLSQILSTRIDRERLSPYQEEGQLRNESYFFGREKIINHIYNRELSNYFIVGARQIGKSSLLRALELKFKTREDVVCFSFEDPRYLLKDIAIVLGLDKNSSLEDIEFFIADSPKKYLFLIDEVDDFVSKEKKNRYKILHAFRSLTQKGKAYFIMAGYYELFSQISFDLKSPIKNFGETIRLGKLEGDACAKLIVEPMENLGLYYQSVDDGAKIIIQTGQRANLIAMVCADIIKNLKPFTNEITRSDIDKALQCSKVRNTHYEWEESIDEGKLLYISQIIVYASVRVDFFTLEDVEKLFDTSVTIKEIKQSLQQLELMYIIERVENSYRYTIPLMQEELKKDAEVMLERVIREFRNI